MYHSICVIKDGIEKRYIYQYHGELSIGQVVLVDFNGRNSIGIVLNHCESIEYEYTGNIKFIISALLYKLSHQYLKFIEFVSEYNLISFGSALKLGIPFSIASIGKTKSNPKVISSICKIDVILSQEQQSAVNIISEYIDKFMAFLLHGITGSGKTEVFLEIAKQLFNKNKQILILVPEISLSNSLAEKISKRCNTEVFIWHTSISTGTKFEIWSKAINNESLIVVGARSALFIPFSNLGLIVVDEEHDSTFKQNDRQIYHARDMAVYLASILNIPIILSSATPSIESYKNAMDGKYKYIKLESRYYNKAVLPSIQIQDMRNSSNNTIFATDTIKEMQKCLELKQQILVFINRRGYAPKKLCTNCGWKITCPACDSWLCYHSLNNRLICHHCGYDTINISKCKKCGNDYLINLGIGIEKVYSECMKLFSSANVIMCSSDNMNTPSKIDNIINKIMSNKVDIILGTQILAKGHNFNNLNLVVIINIDYMLHSEDFRSLEHTYQLLLQVSGRAGRTGAVESKVIIQTYNPDDPLLRLYQGYDYNYSGISYEGIPHTFKGLNIHTFYQQELSNRKQVNMPPYGYISSIEVSSKSEQVARVASMELINLAPKHKNISIIGPIKPVLHKLKYKYRYKILFISKSYLQPYIKRLKSSIKSSSKFQIKIDLNPYEFS